MSPFQRKNSHESNHSSQWDFVARKVIQLEAELQSVRSVSPQSNMRSNMSAYR